MEFLPEALKPFADYKQFILYKLVPNKDNPDKTDKFPCDINGKVDDAHNANIWIDVETALNVVKLFGDNYGVGFVFTKNDPFYFFDIDNCLMPDGITWSADANDLMARFPGAAVEISQSGKGLHIFGIGSPTLQTDFRRKKSTNNKFDLYTEGRFVALTGYNIIGNAATSADQKQLDYIVNTYLKNDVVNPTTWTNQPVPEWNGLADDNKLLEKALGTKSVAASFGAKANFADLWHNNLDVLLQCYPGDQNPNEIDDSKVDQALAQHLAFWTGNNCERIFLLMYRSGLVRDKWNKRPKYLQDTILKAVSMQTTVYTAGNSGDDSKTLKLRGTERQIKYANEIINNYNDSRILELKGPALNAAFWIENKHLTIDEIIASCKPIESAVDPLVNLTEPEILAGYQFLGATQQIEHFKGCVYIQDIHRVLTPAGSFLRSEQFNSTYGGYVFQLDANGSGKTTRKAWEAFTESQLVRYPIAESTCFHPKLKPGEFVKEEGKIAVNAYVPIETPRIKGDPSRFLNHVKKLLPDERDQEILLSYMAACIQYKGVKFQWCPIIQGTPGNGKSLLTRCVAFAIGKRYSHMPKADDIDNKFNGWILNKLFIGVEDIYVPTHRREVIQALLPMITNEILEIQFKGVDQVTKSICANFILNMNEKSGFKKDKNDRRFAMFYTTQQTAADVIRDGMSGNYFPDLYNWLKADGYAIVADYLENYPIKDEFNPASYCHRAPETSSTNEAIATSLGPIEQEINEAIGEGRPGFAGGWISSMALDRLLQTIRAGQKIPRNKRREVLQSLGYDWHPALNEGRVNNIVPFDGGKPRIFIRNDHPDLNLTTAAEVINAYQVAQGASSASIIQTKFRS